MLGKTPAVALTRPNYWINARNYSSLSNFITYQNNTLTGSGSSGTTTITASADASNLMFIGQKFRIGANDVYTIANISTTTITTVETLTANYTTQILYNLKDSQISDSSGNFNNATNATASSQPTYVQTGIGSQPALGFDSIDDYISSPASSSINDIFASGGTIALVFKNRSLALNLRRLLDKDSGAATTGFIIALLDAFSSPATSLRFSAPFTGTLGIWASPDNSTPINTNLIVFITYNSSSAANVPTIYINSATASTLTTLSSPTGSSVSDAANALFIGNRSLLDRTLNGYISEVIAWKRVLSSTEINMLMKNLGKKYGVAIS